MNKSQIKAVFSNYPKFLAALKQLAALEIPDLEVLSPVPLHDVEKLLPQKPSGVRWFTFLGGLLGLTIGIGLPVYSVRQWPLITGGKPLQTMPAFIIIAFELLILLGAIATLAGLILYARLPRHNLRGYDPRFSENSFGFVIAADVAQIPVLKQILKDADDLVIEQPANLSGEVTHAAR